MPTEHTLRLGIDSRTAESGSRRTVGALAQVRRAANNAASSVDRIREEFRGLERIGDTIGRLGRRLTIGLTLPLAALATGAVAASAQLDSLRRGMVAVSVSAAAAEREISRMREVAALPGLGFREAIQGSVNLQAAGLSAELARDALIGFGNALATVGRGRHDLDLVQLALSQIASKGRVAGQEIRQLAERVPQIRQIMIEAFGTANTEELAAQGIAAQEFIRRVTDELLKLPRVTGGIQNSLENLGDSAFRAAAALGNRLLPVVEPLISRLAELLEQTEALDPSTVRWGIALGTVAAVLGPLSLALGSLTTAATALAGALSVSLLPLIGVGGAVLLGLGALATLFLKNRLEAAATRQEIEKLAAAARDLSDAMPAELLDTQDALEERQRELIAQSNRLRGILADLPEGRLRNTIQDTAAGVLRELNAVNNRLEEVRARLVEATTLEPITIEVDSRAAGQALDSTIENFRRLEDAIARTQERIGDIRFELSSVFERDRESAADLRDELGRLERQLVSMQAARRRIIESASIPAPDIGLVDSIDLGPRDPNGQIIDVVAPPPPDLTEVQQAWDEAIRGIQRTFATGFADIFRDGIDGFDDFAGQVLDIFVRLAAEIAAAFAIQKLGIDQLIGQIQAGVPIGSLTGTAASVARFGGSAAIGVGIGAGTGSPFVGALGGAAAGFALGGPVGAIVGGVSGLVSGLFGASREAERAAEQARRAAAEMERAAAEMERAVGRWRESIERAFDTGPRDTLVDRFVDDFQRRFELLPPALQAVIEDIIGPIAEIDTPAEALEAMELLKEFSEGRVALPKGTVDDFFAFIDDIALASELLAQAMAERERDFLRDLDVRELVAQGRNDEAEALRLRIQQEEELAQARALGFDEATISRLEEVHAMERERQAREATTDAIRDATSALNAPSGLRLSLFRWRASLEEDLDELVPDPRDPRQPTVPGTPPIPIGPAPTVPDPRVDPLPPGHGGLTPLSMNINRVEILVRSNGRESEIELARKVQRGLAQIGLRGGGDPTVVALR